MTDTKFVCPECGSDDCVVVAEQSFNANTGDHWCHDVKTHDADAKARCLDCDWAGTRNLLKTIPTPSNLTSKDDL